MTSLSQEALLVRAALEAEGLETPLVANELSGQQKKEKIEGHMRAIMETLGLDWPTTVWPRPRTALPRCT